MDEVRSYKTNGFRSPRILSQALYRENCLSASRNNSSLLDQVDNKQTDLIQTLQKQKYLSLNETKSAVLLNFKNLSFNQFNDTQFLKPASLSIVYIIVDCNLK